MFKTYKATYEVYKNTDLTLSRRHAYLLIYTCQFTTGYIQERKIHKSRYFLSLSYSS